MLVAPLLLVLSCVLAVLAAPLEPRGVSSVIYDNLVFYFKYASSAYRSECDHPNGNTLVTRFINKTTDTHVFVARDDNRKEIVVVFRGSFSLTNFFTDFDFVLRNYSSPGVSPPEGTLVHRGFAEAYNSVAETVIATVSEQLKAFSDYSLVTSGHSLGGALSSLAAVSLKGNFPHKEVTMYTYGQPRTGNDVFAFWVNRQFGHRAFRGVHLLDGVPTMVPRLLGYRHHGIEYWSYLGLPSARNTKECAADGEDPTCSDKFPSTGINLDHTIYYGILASTPFCKT